MFCFMLVIIISVAHWPISLLRNKIILISIFAGTSGGFEGCLKKVKLQGEAIDWFNLGQTVNIHKTACPVT